MHYAKTILIVLGCSGLLFAAAAPAPAAAAPAGACSVTEAHARVHHAARDLARAEARLREARHVLSATRYYSGVYGNGTGRWIRLSRRVGWPWGQMPTLMMVVSRESGGDPAAKNPLSTASGLLQFLSPWFLGKWDPFDPRQNLGHGYRAWRQVGWSPWRL